MGIYTIYELFVIVSVIVATAIFCQAVYNWTQK